MKKILCVLLIVLMIPFAAAESELPDSSLKSATIRFAGDFVIHEPIFKSAERLARSGNSAHDYGRG